MALEHELSYAFGGPDWLVKTSDYLLPRQFFLHIRGDEKSATVPTVALGFEVIDGNPQCRSVSVTSSTNGREIRAADVRKILVEDMLELAVSELALRIIEWEDNRIGMTDDTDPVEVRKSIRAVRRQSRTQISSEKLARVAEVYRANPHAPTRAVADEFGIAERTASLYVRRARDAGVLGEALKGKGGEQ